MPEPTGRGQRYVPGLDGVRALAVLAVIAYHLGFGWAGGGLLGVGVFFTLSGYLITDLLLGHFDATGKPGLGDFWLRRARRLLPALYLMLVVVVAWVTLLHRNDLASIRGTVVAAIAYVSNWWLIYQHVPYFARFGSPSPLGHLWSLAVEEQFYLLWPWLLMLGLRIAGRRRAGGVIRPRLAALTLVLAVASALLMAVLYRPGLASTRAYDGSDTRAFGLLIGAALAMVWPSRHLRASIAIRARLLMDGLGAAALAGIVLMIWRTNEYSAFLYKGGLVLLSVATAIVVAAVVHPASWLGRFLGVAPLRWLGVRSYGIYLWHYPIIVLSTSSAFGRVSLLRAGLQVAATIALAALSWHFFEEPIRRGAIGRLWLLRRTGKWRSWLRGWRWVAITAAIAVLATACVGMGTTNPTSSKHDTGTVNLVVTHSRSPSPIEPSPIESTPNAVGDPAPESTTSPASAATSAASVPPPPPATTTSCTSVVHIGDSTSEGMISPDYLPNPAQRVDAQYARVGVGTVHIEISGGTSILETAVAGQPNAYQVAQQLINSGYKGCWVLALGTNDTADVYVGSVEDRDARIAKMMTLIGSQPVIWVNVKSIVATGAYSSTNMQLWNSALLAACVKYPSMRVYDWASAVQTSWFSSDHIHFTSAGYAARSQLVADSLVHAFPAAQSPTPGCVVS